MTAFSREAYIRLLKLAVCHWLWLSDEEKQKRSGGRDWPEERRGETMIGMKRLDNLEYCLKDCLENNIPGDVIEAGVWRGGAVIFMKGIIDAFGDRRRKVWVADSFAGVPKPDIEMYPQDAEDELYKHELLTVARDEVERNFSKYGLLDSRVQFLEGWFKDTLPSCEIEKLAILRIDCDLYESTFQCLEYLYPKLSSGGYCIIDDYGTFPYCKQAVDDYRLRRMIKEPIIDIDGWGVFWQKT